MLESCYSKIGDPKGFTPAEEVYERSEDPLVARMWDVLRFSCTNSRDEKGFIKTSAGTQRLKLIQEILEYRDEESELLSNDGQINDLANLFSGLMEWSRPPKPKEEDGHETSAKWVSRRPRLVGRDNLEWGVLFDGRECSKLRDLGVEAKDIFCMRNGLRLLKTNAAASAGITISDRLPVMDECYETAEQHIISIISHAEANRDRFAERANIISNGKYEEYMLAFPFNLIEGVSLGLYSKELHEKKRSNWKGRMGWWRKGDYPVAKITFDDGDIALHRFVADDPVEEHKVSTLVEAVLRFNSGDVVSLPLMYSDGNPHEWVDYAKAGSKRENYRKYRFMRETVRAFVIASLGAKDLKITHPEDIPDFLRITIPYEIKSFILWPSMEKSRLGQVSLFDPELALFISSNTLRQLWLS